MIKKIASLLSLFTFTFFMSGCGGVYVPPRSNPYMAPQRPVVIMETSKGSIYIELYEDKVPKSVENFLKYVDAGYYDGLIFHRVIKGNIIQGGGMTDDLKRKDPLYDPIENEASEDISNVSASISYARTDDPNSATSQFFINITNNFNFDYRSPSSPGYAVFGRVLRGFDVCEKIADVKTGSKNGFEDVPEDTVYILKAYRK
jgi:cyclophilin family peptidyl-prolyl cis-trans isomerase